MVRDMYNLTVSWGHIHVRKFANIVIKLIIKFIWRQFSCFELRCSSSLYYSCKDIFWKGTSAKINRGKGNRSFVSDQHMIIIDIVHHRNVLIKMHIFRWRWLSLLQRRGGVECPFVVRPWWKHLSPHHTGAFPHTKKSAIWIAIQIATIFARVHTGRKKRDLNRDYFFTRVPTQAEKSRPKSHRFERAVHVYCL